MKRLIISFVFSFIVLFLIWATVLYLKHPNSFDDLHLDMYSTIEKLASAEVISIQEFCEELDGFRFNSNLTVDTNDDILSILSFIFLPILYLFRVVVDLIDFILIIFEFIFNPVVY